MDVDTNWDTEKYRTKFEAEEHWTLKKHFIDSHKDRIPEERLICLAQVFVNIELLRCKYPDKVMEQVSLLAKDVGHDYKAKQKQRLQRTFVKASDAASAKVRGLTPNYSGATPSSSRDVSFATNSQAQTIATNPQAQTKYLKALKREVPTESRLLSASATPRMRCAQNKFRKLDFDVPATQSNANLQKECDPDGPFAHILLICNMYSNFSGSYNFLKCSLEFSSYELLEDYKENFHQITCFLRAKQKKETAVILLGRGEASTVKKARDTAADNAVELLLANCYTIKVLQKSSSDNEISLTNTFTGQKGSEAKDQSKLDDNSVGAKLLKLMGWSGGALGKSGEGITEPIACSSVMGRQGLGLKDESNITPKFKSKVRELLKKFMKGEKMSDLVFASDLSSDQRKHIHMIASQIGRGKIKSTSYGKGEARYLILSHKLKGLDLLQKVQEEGGMTAKYKLCPPGTLTVSELKEIVM